MGKFRRFGKIAGNIALCLCGILLIATFANLVFCTIEKDGLKKWLWQIYRCKQRKNMR
jgi:hypothetical protein